MLLSGARARLVLGSLAALLLASLAACGDDPALSALAADDVVLAFGDSITYGTGAAEGESYPEVLQALIGRRVVRSGVPGEVTGRGLERLPGVLDEVMPKLVILCHGGNDILRRQSRAAVGDNLRAMIGLIREQGAEVVMIGVPQFGLILDTAPVYTAVAEELKVPMDAEILPSILGDNDLKADNVHPNAEGYARLAGALRDLLTEQGAL